MRQQALATLLRIRQANLDDAEKSLAEALRSQQRVQALCEDETALYAREAAAALDLAAGDEAVDAFARWLPTGRKAVEAARSAEQEATGEVERARILLGLARAAHRSAELLVEKRSAEISLNQQRQEQHGMDDIASRIRQF